MKDIKISELRKKKIHIGIRVSDEESVAIKKYCTREQISITDFFRLAIRKIMNEEKVGR